MSDYKNWSLMVHSNLGYSKDIRNRNQTRINRYKLYDYLMKLVENNKYPTYLVIKNELIETFSQKEFENNKEIIIRYLKYYTSG